MKRMFTLVPSVTLFILGLGFLGDLGLGDAGIGSAAQAAPVCSLATLKGGYGYTFTGSRPTGLNAVAVGVLTFSGEGNVTGADTLATNTGVNGAPRTITGTYTVNADCTGTMSLDYNAGGGNIAHVDDDIVIVSTGKKILAIILENPASGALGTLVADKM